jgi:hypothetical protein
LGPVILEEVAGGGVPVATVIREEVVAAVPVAAEVVVEVLGVASEGEMGGVPRIQVVVAEQVAETRILFHRAKLVPFRNRSHWPW